MKTKLLLSGLAAIPLAGCISVDPPDKPIDINLNVRIEQEVLVRLDQEVDALIADNPEAFPDSDPDTTTTVEDLPENSE
ncbi:YnbE family lipoprotein [Sphingomicrobium clamense]|uniref:YnbE family lipoprotein n=1 Tax=Sphingomicrobium clamense TaxID=2851013 RepID=A0ABS6V577_9SPHN|nr:YnbE family lipoprotein [Sphingomicrobium sp. B8]